MAQVQDQKVWWSEDQRTDGYSQRSKEKKDPCRFKPQKNCKEKKLKCFSDQRDELIKRFKPRLLQSGKSVFRSDSAGRTEGDR